MFYIENKKEFPILYINTNQLYNYTTKVYSPYFARVTPNNLWTYHNTNQGIIGGLYKDFKDKFNRLKGGKITTDNGNIYFSRQSEYPRFKIKNTKYTRVLSPENADYYVYNSEDGDFYSSNPEVYVVQTDYCYFVINDDVFTKLGTKDLKWIIDNSNQHFNYCGKTYPIPKTGKLVYKGRILLSNSKTCQFMMDVMDNKITKLINDKDFDKYVCKQLNTVSVKDIETVIELLQSQDQSTRDVGWKTLQGFDVAEIPNVFRCLIYLYSNTMSSSILNSAGMQATINSLNINKRAVKNNAFCSLTNLGRNMSEWVYNDKEKCLLSFILKKSIEKYIDNDLKAIQYMFSNLGLRINYDISFVDGDKEEPSAEENC